MNLAPLDKVETWQKVEEICREILDSIPNLDTYENELKEFGRTKEFITREELDKVVLWRHAVGKSRIYNVKYLNTNLDESVIKHSKAAMALATNLSTDECLEEDGSLSTDGRKLMQDCMKEFAKLKGVGPATSSAVLSLIRPDLFCYLYDEVLECLEAHRDYKISNYLRVNSRCLQIARGLGPAWNAARVSRTIWMAARFLATYRTELIDERNRTSYKRIRLSDEGNVDDAGDDQSEDNDDDYSDGSHEYTGDDTTSE